MARMSAGSNGQSVDRIAEPSRTRAPWLAAGGLASEPQPRVLAVHPARAAAPASGQAALVAKLRGLALAGLPGMYQPHERLFVFRVRRTQDGVRQEGVSWRYTAIALIGLAAEDESATLSALSGDRLLDVCGHLVGDVGRIQNLGDVALILWAAQAVGYPDRRWIWERLEQLDPGQRPYPTVELAWTLAALCIDAAPALHALRDRVARRLLGAFDPRSALFPHFIGKQDTEGRSHVSCFADLVYPIHALSLYHSLSGDRQALEAASACAERICRLQGPAGQWWWHYDRRTGRVIEPYPVYAIHQDAMAPMALLALQAASRTDYSAYIAKGLDWLAHAPELGGGSLIDDRAGLVWRKVARREPRKLCRALQTVATAIHPALRVPGLDRLFPPGAIDFEDRPYHLGWFLYAWARCRS
jgi:hypothetical protein